LKFILSQIFIIFSFILSELTKEIEPPTVSSSLIEKSSSKTDETTPLFSLDDLDKVEHPNGEIKIMIDKLAEYVARNGIEFEENIRKKNDERFNFLQVDHKFYKYYKITIIKLKRERVLNEKSKSTPKISSNSKQNDSPVTSPKIKPNNDSGDGECASKTDVDTKEKEIKPLETSGNGEDEETLEESMNEIEPTTKSVIKIGSSNSDHPKDLRRSRSRSKSSRGESSKRRRRSAEKEHKRKKESKRRHSEKHHRHHKKDEKHRSRKKSERSTSRSRSSSSSSSSSRNSSDISSDSELKEKRKRSKKSSSTRHHRHKDSERHRDHKKKHKKKRSKDRSKK